jgi:hypothetical protein
MLTVLFIGVLCYLGLRLVRGVAGKAKATTASVKAKSHWLWITVAVVAALAFAHYR